MSTLDDLTPDAFARLTALEQSQELLCRAQFLNDASQRWHAETLPYLAHQTRHDEAARPAYGPPGRHGASPAGAPVPGDGPGRPSGRQTGLAGGTPGGPRQPHGAAWRTSRARIQLTLDAVLEMLRHPRP